MSQAAGDETLLPALEKDLEQKGMTHVTAVAGGVVPQQE